MASNNEQLAIELYNPVYIESGGSFYDIEDRTLDDEISDLIIMQRNLIKKIDKLLENSGLARKTEDLTNE